MRSFNVSVDGPDAATHDGGRGCDGAFARAVANLRYLISLREQFALRVRMNMTVREPTVSRLEEMAGLARHIDVPLYLNLGTDKTFLFRDDSVSASVAVVAERAADGVRPLEAAELTLDPRIPGPSQLEYVKHFFGAGSAFSARRDPPCAESLLKILVTPPARWAVAGASISSSTCASSASMPSSAAAPTATRTAGGSARSAPG